jgi:hypothetical protein
MIPNPAHKKAVVKDLGKKESTVMVHRLLSGPSTKVIPKVLSAQNTSGVIALRRDP